MPVFSRTARSFGAPSVLPMPDYNALVFKRPFLAFRAGLPFNVRSRSGQPCSLCRAGDLCVLRPARRIHIRLRGRVLHNSPPPASVRSALAPTVTALGTLGSSARCSGSRPPSRSLRRRSRRLRGDTRRNASSVNTPPRLATCLTAHPTNRVVACRSVRHSPPSSLASPSIRRVFLRSFCARRRSVVSLNLARVSPGAKRSRRRRAQCGVQIRTPRSRPFGLPSAGGYAPPW